MFDTDHTAAGQRPGKDDCACPSGPHLLSRTSGEVHATVPFAEGMIRGIESTGDRYRLRQRGAPVTGGCTGQWQGDADADHQD